MSTYLIINLLILTGPLVVSLLPKFRPKKFVKPYLLSTLIVGGTFIVWDIYATAQNQWGFNPKHIRGYHLLNLPLEEVLFFIVVPYSMLFTYEIIRKYAHNQDFTGNQNILFIFTALAALIAIVFKDQGYSFIIFVSLAVTLLAITQAPFNAYIDRHYWIYIGIGFLVFFIFNTVLTAFPIVIYGPNAIFGIRLGTIPVEDFIYNYVLITWYLLVYRYAKEKI